MLFLNSKSSIRLKYLNKTRSTLGSQIKEIQFWKQQDITTYCDEFSSYIKNTLMSSKILFLKWQIHKKYW
jgi:hypothetical protein